MKIVSSEKRRLLDDCGAYLLYEIECEECGSVFKYRRFKGKRGRFPTVCLSKTVTKTRRDGFTYQTSVPSACAVEREERFAAETRERKRWAKGERIFKCKNCGKIQIQDSDIGRNRQFCYPVKGRKSCKEIYFDKYTPRIYDAGTVRRSSNTRQRESGDLRICAWCGKEYSGTNARFCGAKCAQEYLK